MSRARIAVVVAMVWLGLLLAPPGLAQPADRPIEEVQVTAFNGCGPWPIRHRLISTCSYAQLKNETLAVVRALRDQVFENCLSCRDGVCHPNYPSAESADRGRLCRKLFWTPTRVGVLQAHILHTRDLLVDFSYAISPRGRVTDIQITYLESEIDRRTVLAMIKEGAAQIEFEPVEQAGVPVKIADLVHGFTLEGR